MSRTFFPLSTSGSMRCQSSDRPPDPSTSAKYIQSVSLSNVQHAQHRAPADGQRHNSHERAVAARPHKTRTRLAGDRHGRNKADEARRAKYSHTSHFPPPAPSHCSVRARTHRSRPAASSTRARAPPATRSPSTAPEGGHRTAGRCAGNTGTADAPGASRPARRRPACHALPAACGADCTPPVEHGAWGTPRTAGEAPTAAAVAPSVPECRLRPTSGSPQICGTGGSASLEGEPGGERERAGAPRAGS